MSVSTGPQIASFDAEINAALPTVNAGTRTVIGLDSSPLRYGFLYFALPPALPGETIISATLKLYQWGAASGGSRTLTVQRASKAWTASKITWNNRPLVTGPQATKTLGNGGASGRLWEFDVTAAIAQVAAGAQWFGFNVRSNNATVFGFFSKEAGAHSYRPTLEIVYESDADAPTNLIPGNGSAVSIARPTLQWASLLAGSIAAYRVQVSTVSDFSSTVVDTGKVFSTLPEYTLTTDLSLATTYYWRVKVWNDADLESEWSEYEEFTRTAKSSLTIDNPAADPNDFVTESTPPFGWTFGGTQVKFQVQVWNVTDGDVLLYDSEPEDGTDDDHSPTSNIRFELAKTYRVDVYVWDDVDRAATPGDAPWVLASREFTFQLGVSVDPVDTLVLTVDGSPYATLEVTRATAPDFFQVFNDGVPLSGLIEPSDVFVAGTTYEIVLRNLDPRRTYGDVYVACIVNGVTSDANPTVSVTTEPEGIWLTDRDGLNPVCINSDDSIGSWSSGEISAVHAPVGSPYSVVLWQTPGGRNGEVSGFLVGGYGKTPDVDLDEWKARWKALTNPLGQKLLLTLTDSTIPVHIRKPLMSPATEHLEVPVSFEAYERPPD